MSTVTIPIIGLVLCLLLAAALGALCMAGYALFLMAAALWSDDSSPDPGSDDSPADTPAPAPADPHAADLPPLPAPTMPPVVAPASLIQNPTSKIQHPPSLPLLLIDGPLDGIPIDLPAGDQIHVRTGRAGHIHRYIRTGGTHASGRLLYLHAP